MMPVTMRADMDRADFEFELPRELIAQTPAERRTDSRLLSLDGVSGRVQDLQFTRLPDLLEPGDLLVLNDTRVVPARVFGTKATGGRVEVLLERCTEARLAWVHIRASKPLRPGAVLRLDGEVDVRVRARDDDLFLLEFPQPVLQYFSNFGRVPLPPYITREASAEDVERYQTVFAREPGAVAAPTAGLHFDAALFDRLEARDVRRAYVTLHVGSGTFSPVREQALERHRMHPEAFRIPDRTVELIAATRSAGARVVAVGTTVVRTLESAARHGTLMPGEGLTDLFILPGFEFKVVDALITNFHLPGSTLLMLCSAFVGREQLLAAYRHAVRQRYRFYSYGDAMWLTPPPRAAAGAVGR